MEIVLRAAALGVIGSLLALLLRKTTPELALCLSLLAGLLCAWLCSDVCAEVVQTLSTIARRSGVSGVLLAPVAKCVGIGLVTETAAQLCRDAKQGATASFLELCGTLCALYVSLPLVRAFLSTVNSLA